MADALILVNEKNRAVGQAEKRKVHEAGWLHRAFSIFLVDQAGQILLQQRHPAKYHSGGLWANSCCGHPHPGEQTIQAAQRRLGEELGVTCSLTFGFFTRYGTAFPDGLKENEFVYVYFGVIPAGLRPDPTEISILGLRSLPQLKAEIGKKPEDYAFWLKFYVAHHLPEISEGIDGVLRRTRRVSPSRVAGRAQTAARSFA